MKHTLLAVLIALSGFTFGQNIPQLKNDTVAVCLGKTATIAVLANDVDLDGDSLYIDSIFISSQNGAVSHDGVDMYYTPNASFVGRDKVYFKVCDNSIFKQCAFSFLVLDVDTCIYTNFAPVAVDDVITICHNTSATLYPIGNDTDANGDSIAITQFLSTAQFGTDSFVNGLFYYTPTTLSGIDSIAYELCDFAILATPKCDTGYIIIKINDCTPLPNRPPTATIDIVPGLEDLFTIPFDPRSNDSDPDGDPLTWTAVIGPFNGTIVQFGNQWIYRPNPNFNGIDIMPYKVCDNGTPSLCAYSVVTFIIAPRNDAPVAVNDTVTVLEDTRTQIDVLRNDKDIDGDVLKVKQVFPANNGTVELINGKVFYTPNLNYYGSDVFRYRVCDSTLCDNANVYITVLPVDDAPVAVADSVRLSATSASVSVDVLNNDYDVEQDSFWISQVGSGLFTNAQVETKDGKTVLTISRNKDGDCGSDTIRYEICNAGGCSSALVNVEVGCTFSGKLPEGFSPGNDGVNDFLVFEKLDDYKPLGLKVFNRWGDVVYQTRDYQNDWNGNSQKEKQALPDGTYYYILTLSTGEEHIRYCIINR